MNQHYESNKGFLWIWSGRELVPYRIPNPEIGIHRYVFSLFKQPRRGTVVADPTTRRNFSTRGFAERNDLGLPVSVVYFNARRETSKVSDTLALFDSWKIQQIEEIQANYYLAKPMVPKFRSNVDLANTVQLVFYSVWTKGIHTCGSQSHAFESRNWPALFLIKWTKTLLVVQIHTLFKWISRQRYLNYC